MSSPSGKSMVPITNRDILRPSSEPGGSVDLQEIEAGSRRSIAAPDIFPTSMGSYGRWLPASDSDVYIYI